MRIHLRLLLAGILLSFAVISAPAEDRQTATYRTSGETGYGGFTDEFQQYISVQVVRAQNPPHNVEVWAEVSKYNADSGGTSIYVSGIVDANHLIGKGVSENAALWFTLDTATHPDLNATFCAWQDPSKPPTCVPYVGVINVSFKKLPFGSSSTMVMKSTLVSPGFRARSMQTTDTADARFDGHVFGFTVSNGSGQIGVTRYRTLTITKTGE